MLWVAMAMMVGSMNVADAVEPAGDQAEALIQRGIELRKAGDDRGAFPELRRAYELSPNPRAAAQLGLVEQAVGRWNDAELHLSEALRAGSDPWIQKNRAVLEQALTVTRGHVASVEIAGEPAGAEVYVNGRRVGSLPLTAPVRVIAGEVDIEVRAEGHKRSIQKIAMEAHQFRALVIRLDRVAEQAVSAAPPVVTPQREAQASPLGTEIPVEPHGSGTAFVEKAPPPTASLSTSTPRRSLRPLVGWTAAGVGGATAVVGLVVALIGQSNMDAAVAQAGRANMTLDASLYMSASEGFSGGERQRTAGRIMLAVGSVVAVGGVALALTAPSSESGPLAANIRPWAGTINGQVSSGGFLWCARW